MLTLGTQRDLTNDMLIKGIIDSVVTVNQFYAMLPFKGIEGNALAYNREGTTDQMTLVGTVNTAHTSILKNAQEFTRHSTELTTLIGDAQVNGLVQAVGSDFHDATAVQVAAKAKGIGRSYMNLLINGNETGSFSNDQVVDFVTIRNLLIGARAAINGVEITSSLTAAQLIAATAIITVSLSSGTVRVPISQTRIADAQDATNGTVTLAGTQDVLNEASRIVNGFDGFDGLSVFSGAAIDNDARTESLKGNALLGRLDRYIDSIHDKDGMVDYMMLNSRGVRKITQAFRQVGTGFDMMDVKTSSGGLMQVQSYRGVPIFRNDFVQGTDLSSVTGGDLGLESVTTGDDIYIGTLDDGSMTHGICGLTAKKSAGMQVQKLGAREDVDADITRVKWYCGLAHFSELGLVRGTI